MIKWLVTGERASTNVNGFNPAFQRHAAIYKLCSSLLENDIVLDLGCGTGHSFHYLAPRKSIGLDVFAPALREQGRPTVQASMCHLPVRDKALGGIISSHSIEHVRDPEPVLSEASRVLRPGGVALFITPNRLTFGCPDEIIDPYHFKEFSPTELKEACSLYFSDVVLMGLFGSARYTSIMDGEKRTMNMLLRLDFMKIRRLIPLKLKAFLYDTVLTVTRVPRKRSEDASITIGDFSLGTENLESAADLIAVCRAPRVSGGPSL
jgi:SAM-dependent methyltransferase